MHQQVQTDEQLSKRLSLLLFDFILTFNDTSSSKCAV